MENSATSRVPADETKPSRWAWVLLLGLLSLRILLLTGARCIFGSAVSGWALVPDWVLPVFEVGSYALIAIFIWCEKERLAEYHIDRLALAIIIVGKPLELVMHRLHIPFTLPEMSRLYLLNLPIVIGLIVGLVWARPKMPKMRGRNWLWTVVGIVTGSIMGAFFGYITRVQAGQGGRQLLTWSIVIFLPVRQMLHVGLIDELVFRGIFWGLLRRTGIKETWIWLLQGVLSWVAHIYYLGQSPLSFWVIVPLAVLFLGLLAWRSRSIATSILGIGLINGVGQIIAFYRF